MRTRRRRRRRISSSEHERMTNDLYQCRSEGVVWNCSMLSERSAGDDCHGEFVDTHLEMEDAALHPSCRSTRTKRRREYPKHHACERETDVQKDGMTDPGDRSTLPLSFFLSFSYFSRALLVESSPSSKSKANNSQPCFHRDEEVNQTSLLPLLTLIVRTRVHLLLSGARSGITVRFELVGGVLLNTVRIQTLSILKRNHLDASLKNCNSVRI